MRGPYERLKYDLRRIWECPTCGRLERTEGSTTFRLCRCGPKPPPGAAPVLMRLVSDGALRVQPPFQWPEFPPDPPPEPPRGEETPAVAPETPADAAPVQAPDTAPAAESPAAESAAHD